MHSSKAQKIWVAIRFLHFSLEALGHSYYSDRKIIIDNNKKICDLTKNIEVFGVAIGDDILKTILLYKPEKITRNNYKENELIKNIEHSAYQFSPHFYWSENTLLIEISSSLKLFGGLIMTIEKMINEINNYTYQYIHVSLTKRIVISYTAESAKILSFIDNNNFNVESSYHNTEIDYLNNVLNSKHVNREYINNKIKNIPILLILNFPKEVKSLLEMGFNTIGDIIKLSPHELKKRFDKEFYSYIEDLFDENIFSSNRYTKKNGRPYVTKENIFEEKIDFEFPVKTTVLLHSGLKILLVRLSRFLIKYQIECEQLLWTMSDINKHSVEHKINIIAMCSQWKSAYKMTRLYFSQKNLPFEVDTLMLRIDCLSKKSVQSINLFDENTICEKNKKEFFKKMEIKIGKHNCFKISVKESVTPEESTDKFLIDQNLPQSRHKNKIRPPFIYISPILLKCKKNNLAFKEPIKILSDAERIYNVWQEPMVWRDYYIARSSSGELFWIYYDLKNKDWFLHGKFL